MAENNRKIEEAQRKLVSTNSYLRVFVFGDSYRNTMFWYEILERLIRYYP